MHELDTAGVERFPGTRERGGMGKRGTGQEEKMEGGKRKNRDALAIFLFPVALFLRVFRHRFGLAALVSAGLRPEADRQSIPTVDGYYS